jgi:hypothetical protein
MWCCACCCVLHGPLVLPRSLRLHVCTSAGPGLDSVDWECGRTHIRRRIRGGSVTLVSASHPQVEQAAAARWVLPHTLFCWWLDC